MAWQIVSIDDLSEVGELIRITLRHPDIALHEATDGPSGLALVRALTPDLVILDLMMPGMDGWEVYDTIRTDDALANTPVIILSVVADQAAQRKDFKQKAIDCYVTKPFDVHQLRAHVKRLLDAPDLWP